MEYTLIFCNRKTVGFRITDEGLLIRAPKGMAREKIDKLVEKHRLWIERNLDRHREKKKRFESLDQQTEKQMREDAKKYFSEKLDYYASVMGLKYGKMKITSAKGRFGSCNSKGTICFSYRLMMYPEEAREYVVVHELAHLVQMNHSPRFYAIVEKIMPDYKEKRRLLKK